MEPSAQVLERYRFRQKIARLAITLLMLSAAMTRIAPPRYALIPASLGLLGVLAWLATAIFRSAQFSIRTLFVFSVTVAICLYCFKPPQHENRVQIGIVWSCLTVFGWLIWLMFHLMNRDEKHNLSDQVK